MVATEPDVADGADEVTVELQSCPGCAAVSERVRVVENYIAGKEAQAAQMMEKMPGPLRKMFENMGGS